MIILVAPVATNRYTGGHLVNDRLAGDPRVRLLQISSLDEAATPIARMTEAADRVTAAADGTVIVVDSLFLPDTAGIRTLRDRAVGPIGLMAHSLPSLIPGAPVANRRGDLEFERASLALFDFAVVPSEFMLQALTRRGFPPGRAFQIAPAPIVDGRCVTAGRRRHEGEPVRILTIANWSPSKGIDAAWRAVQQSSDIDWRWTIIGAWDRSEFGRRLRDDIAAGGPADRIEIRSTVRPDELHEAYHSADLFVLPSTMESYGLVFAEALTHGLPILAASAGAVPEVVGDAAVLTAAGDADGLAGELRRLMIDGRERERLSGLARERASVMPVWPQVRERFVAAAQTTAVTRTR